MPPYGQAASAGVWIVACVTVAGVIARPWRTSEWHWAIGGAALLLALRLTPPSGAWAAIARGGAVYAFLAGILVLAELARAHGVFGALAIQAGRWCAGSRGRLFALIYAVGTGLTALLCNDTTIIVLTPAVVALADGGAGEPMPYLYACALVANAASFVLPFSNPANLLVYGRALPPLGAWVAGFGPAALVAIVVTYGVLRFVFRRELRGSFVPASPQPPRRARSVAGAALAASAVVLVLAAGFGWNVGLAALFSAVAAFVATAAIESAPSFEAIRATPWEIIPLVAGLLVVVDAVDRSGALSGARALLQYASHTGPPWGPMLVAFAAAAASNVANNLPVALAASYALPGHASEAVARACVVGIDLGPNAAVTGSLATLLWLVILRRSGRDVSAWTFLRIGIVACVPALFFSTSLLR